MVWPDPQPTKDEEVDYSTPQTSLKEQVKSSTSQTSMELEEAGPVPQTQSGGILFEDVDTIFDNIMSSVEKEKKEFNWDDLM